MRRVSPGMARPGMILAKGILGSNGQILLRAGVEIKTQYLGYLKGLGIEYIYIRDNRINDVQVDDIIMEETRQQARALIKTVMQNAKSSLAPNLKTKSLNIYNGEIVRTVVKIVEELLENEAMMVQLIDIRARDEYLFAHSVNCAVMATLVAVKMKYNPAELKCLATGALLHDLGMVAVPEDILNKRESLTGDERKTIERHPLYGYEIFKKTSIFNAYAGTVILQHHERFQGQGYPHGLTGPKINPMAQVVGIVDAYDALTSERPYRKAYPTHKAVEMLMSRGEECFDLKILQSFLSVIAAYPLGFHVVLSSGESGLVIANNPDFTLRPIVRVLYTGEDLAPHPAPYDLDLSQALNLTITEVLN